MRIRLYLAVSVIAICSFLVFTPLAHSANKSELLAPIISLLVSGDSEYLEQKKIPTLSLLVATDTDKLQVAWIPGSDDSTPADEVVYKVHLSDTESFTPSPTTLAKSVTGESQTEITGLIADTTYHAKVVAHYETSISKPSNSLQAKTHKQKPLRDGSTVVEKAEDLGLGKHTTSDGIVYTYDSGTAPQIGSILFSEDENGGMTIRTVDSASESSGVVTVNTSDAWLTDVFDHASINSAFRLFDISSQSSGIPVTSNQLAAHTSRVQSDGSVYSRIDWKDKLLSAEQVSFARDEADLSVKPEGNTSLIKLYEPYATEESFIVSVSASFEPDLITSAEWGEGVFKKLDAAKVAAKGILSLTAQAKYNFTAAGSVNKDFQLWKKKWVSVYLVGGIPVLQEVTLTLDVSASASALAKIEALARANLTETVEVGATYNGVTWTPYITHNESTSYVASLDILGEANADIRLVPKVEVGFYTVLSSSLTMEPLAQSSLTIEEITNNPDFLAAHPHRVVHPTSFDASLGLESNVAVSLGTLGYAWDVLPSTCVLGTGACQKSFNPVELFSIPDLSISEKNCTLTLTAEDGTNNPFNPGSVNWEVFPDNDASMTQQSCSKTSSTTTCTVKLEPGTANDYSVFASGFGVLGEVGRQYREFGLIDAYQCLVNDEPVAHIKITSPHIIRTSNWYVPKNGFVVDASLSHDAEDNLEDLEFKWIFEGLKYYVPPDEEEWANIPYTSNPVGTYDFPELDKPYNVWLRVKDSGGKTHEVVQRVRTVSEIRPYTFTSQKATWTDVQLDQNLTFRYTINESDVCCAAFYAYIGVGTGYIEVYGPNPGDEKIFGFLRKEGGSGTWGPAWGAQKLLGAETKLAIIVTPP